MLGSDKTGECGVIHLANAAPQVDFPADRGTNGIGGGGFVDFAIGDGDGQLPLSGAYFGDAIDAR